MGLVFVEIYKKMEEKDKQELISAIIQVVVTCAIPFLVMAPLYFLLVLFDVDFETSARFVMFTGIFICVWLMFRVIARWRR